MARERLPGVFGAVLIFCFGAACSSDLKTLKGPLGGASVEVTIHRLDNAKSAPVGTVTVYGRLQIHGRNRIKHANLNCISIAIKDARSSKIYVDRIAHVLTKEYAADANGLVDAPVYWIVPGVSLHEIDLAGVRLVIDDANKRCIAYL